MRNCRRLYYTCFVVSAPPVPSTEKRAYVYTSLIQIHCTRYSAYGQLQHGKYKNPHARHYISTHWPLEDLKQILNT